MDENFSLTEALFRAVRPDEKYWRSDGSLSSAAFKDPHGLSVNRSGNLPLAEAVEIIRAGPLFGTIVYVTVHDCYDVGATVIYAPENENIYHSEIHKDQTTVQLSKGQAKKLAGLARKVDEVAFA